MRLALSLVVLFAGVGAIGAAQERRFPSDNLYRGPLYVSRAAALVEPSNGLPLEFSSSRFALSGLQTQIRSRTIRTIPVSGITLRVAYGPTQHGMVTFRLRPVLRRELPDTFTRITPGAPSVPVSFALAEEDPPPGIVAMTPQMQVVFTVERIESDEGTPIFENPDATELLWEALGRPSLSNQ